MSKIMIVDDSAVFSKVVKTELEKADYKVISAQGYQEAIKFYLKEDLDLIILDIQMPIIDGFEVCKFIQQEDKFKANPIPFIFLTATDRHEDRMKGFELGATDFLLKDFSDGQMVRVVNSILRPDQKFKGLKVLLIDDMPVMSKIVSRYLVQLGLECKTFESSVLAYEYLKLHYKEVDIIVTDVDMPELSGAQLCQKTRRELALTEVPIVIISGIATKESVIEFFNLGATDYLTKPFIKEEFMARVNSILDSYMLKKGIQTTLTKYKNLSAFKDEFLSICSHDLRSPLNAVLAAANLLNREKTLNAKQKKYVGYIMKSSNFLLELINDLLDLRKFDLDESLTLVSCHLNKIIKGSIDHMDASARAKDINIKLDLKTSDDFVVNADAVALTRAFYNLTSNAIKFSPTGSNLDISCEEITSNNKKYVAISFADHGIGIPESKIATLFDQYSKNQQHGTAGEIGTCLGLYIVKKIIIQHQGEIIVNSKEGEGTTFILKIPLT
jgi:DNA-binding response OmpR family regulator/two-component sensor histidine kinase